MACTARLVSACRTSAPKSSANANGASMASGSSMIFGAPCPANSATPKRASSRVNAGGRCSAYRKKTCSISWRRRRPAWHRELLRIVRLIAQYFYPQRQTKLMNEGAATFCHYRIMTRLHDTGPIDDAAYLEFLHSHTNVVMQPGYSDPRYSGVNPYALGF